MSDETRNDTGYPHLRTYAVHACDGDDPRRLGAPIAGRLHGWHLALATAIEAARAEGIAVAIWDGLAVLDAERGDGVTAPKPWERRIDAGAPGFSPRELWSIAREADRERLYDWGTGARSMRTLLEAAARMAGDCGLHPLAATLAGLDAEFAAVTAERDATIQAWEEATERGAFPDRVPLPEAYGGSAPVAPGERRDAA